MALANYSTLSQVRQPGSILQPKPGLLDAGGNTPTPVLTQPEQAAPLPTQPTITPQSEYTPMADPVNPTNSPLSYQEAYTQGQLTQPSAPSSTGGFGGYDPNTPPPNYDPDAWAMSGSVGNFIDARTGLPMGGVSYINPSGGTSYSGDPSSIKTLEDFTRMASGMNDTGRQMLLAQLTPEQLAAVRGTQQFQDVQSLGLGEADNPRMFDGQAVAPGATDDYLGLKEKLGIDNSGLASPITPKDKLQTGSFTPSTNLTEDGQGLGESGTFAQAEKQPAGDKTGLTVPPTNFGKSPVKTKTNEAAGEDSLSKIFKFFKGDLERERDQGIDSARTNAASRGVFYGTPGVQAENDVNEKYQRGLGQFEANLLQNEQQNELARLGLGTSFFNAQQDNEIKRLAIAAGLIPPDAQDTGGVDPSIFAALASIFGTGAGGTSLPKGTNTISGPTYG